MFIPSIIKLLFPFLASRIIPYLKKLENEFKQKNNLHGMD